MTHKIVAYLFTLALGYWVLTLADKQTGFTQKLGKVVGWIILIVSLSGPLCMLGSCLAGHCMMGSHCSMGMSNCPMEHGSMMGGCPMGDMGKKDEDKGTVSPEAKKKN